MMAPFEIPRRLPQERERVERDRTVFFYYAVLPRDLLHVIGRDNADVEVISREKLAAKKLAVDQIGQGVDLLRCNLRTIRAYLLKEEFQFFWQYVYPGSAEKFLDQWCRKVMSSWP